MCAMWLLALVKWWKCLHTTVTELRHIRHSANMGENIVWRSHNTLQELRIYVQCQTFTVAQLSSSMAYSSILHRFQGTVILNFDILSAYHPPPITVMDMTYMLEHSSLPFSAILYHLLCCVLHIFNQQIRLTVQLSSGQKLSKKTLIQKLCASCCKGLHTQIWLTSINNS